MDRPVFISVPSRPFAAFIILALSGCPGPLPAPPEGGGPLPPWGDGRGSPQKAGGPKIDLPSDRIDFGEVSHGQIPSRSFPFTNRGDRDLIITRLRPSCGCVSARVSRERIPPGGSGEILVAYDSKGQRGPDRRRVYVYTNDPERRRITLRIQVSVKAQPSPSLVLVPRFTDLGVVPAGTSRSAEVQAKNDGDRDLVILQVTAPAGAEAAIRPPVRIPPGGQMPIPIRVTPSASAGVQHFPFSVRSNDPYHGGLSFHVAAYVTLPPAPSLRVNRKSLHFGSLGTEPERREVVLYNAGSEDLEVKGARRMDGDPRLVLEVDPGIRIAPGEGALAAISFLGGGGIGSARTRWKIASNDPLSPETMLEITGDIGEGPVPASPPLLSLGHGEWDLGVVSRSAPTSHGLRVFNRGGAPLVIRGLRTYEELHPFEISTPPPIPPGGSGEIRLMLPPAVRAGILDLTFEVESNDPLNPEVPFHVTGYVEKGPCIFPEGSRRFTLLYMGDEAGEIQSCGCGEARLGGLERAATIVKRIRSNRKASLLVGAGDAFGSGGEHFRLRASLHAEALSRMGCDAVTAGEMDFSFGPSFLKETLEGASVPATSLNILEKEGGPPFFPPVIWKDVGGIRVAIVGIADPNIFDPGETLLRAVDPERVLQEHLPRIREEADLVVLLSHLGRKKTIRLLRRVREIDIAVVGHAEEGLDRPIRIGRSVLVENGGAGKTVGLLAVALGSDGQIYIEGERVPVAEDTPRDEFVTALIDRYRRLLRDLPPPPAMRLEESPYAGSEACRDCHPRAYDSWSGSKHGHAFESLRRVGSHYDPECVGCHVVGFGTAGGFVREDLTSDRVHVGCEACHGPGRSHVEGGGVPPYREPDIRSLCRPCHTQDRNPDFSFERSWKEIAHGKE
ncbi:MAG: DUF1573 domain-containing protein [Planctomycetota bacterium]|nr:DUF1573 domain-containing protein [Planctomycetota bacterium]